MSAHKFIPGPWSFVPSIPEQGFECYWLENGVQTISSIDGPQSEEREATARLIAAAPELLEALNAMLGKAYKQNWNDNYPEQVKQAEEAVAKATGEQS